MFTQPNPTRSRSFAGQQLQLLNRWIPGDEYTDSPLLIFIHPPKTGGTNLVFVTLALNTSVRFAVPLVDNVSPNRIKQGWVGGYASALEKLQSHPDCCDHASFVSGHFPLGLHNHLTRKSQYIALIRDPIERAISTTNFDFQRGYVTDALDYLLTNDMDNPQTRLLAGIEAMDSPCDSTTLEKAKHNIENLFFIPPGITDDVNSFIQILASIQGWGSIALTRSQVTGVKCLDQIPPDVLDALKKKHHYDLALYDWAKERWLNWKRIFLQKAKPTDASAEKYLCITSDFSTANQAISMTADEVQHYNQTHSNSIVEVTQKRIDYQPPKY